MSNKINNYAVFCGSRFGSRTEFKEDAAKIGKGLATHNLTLVYGGGLAGLMGVTANAALESGGKVLGVIPKFLHETEEMHPGLQSLEITNTMLERKERLFELSDAYIVLPGGMGTFDELLEALVEVQLNLSKKPIYIINTCGWADKFLELVSSLQDLKFMDNGFDKYYRVFKNASEFLSFLDSL